MRRRTTSTALGTAVASLALVAALTGCQSPGAQSTGSQSTGARSTDAESTAAGRTPAGATAPTPTGLAPTGTRASGGDPSGSTAPAAAMAVDRFWRLVAGTYAHDPDAQAAALEPRLQELSLDDLTGFQRRYVQLANALATPAHYAAAQVVMGDVSQDAFVDLRTWVVFQGQASYESFLADPDSLADGGPTDDEQLGAAETLESLPDDVTVVTPPWAHDATTVYVDPAGEPQHLTYAQLRQRFPRLAAVYLPPDLAATDPRDEGPRSVHRYS